ncbi:hypothetical protein PoB_007054000 [Plakobranchus ocellatus]|uniref:Uncharacterized protein n=1 Tax=Plakobranchus ocellatus TaxID=259542 RepID=A0AAV4DIR9_9GAST|nr:hypothetical protein PoB_007054000 [Plakobranchus ocellatus]
MVEKKAIFHLGTAGTRNSIVTKSQRGLSQEIQRTQSVQLAYKTQHTQECLCSWPARGNTFSLSKKCPTVEPFDKQQTCTGPDEM